MSFKAKGLALVWCFSSRRDDPSLNRALQIKTNRQVPGLKWLLESNHFVQSWGDAVEWSPSWKSWHMIIMCFNYSDATWSFNGRYVHINLRSLLKICFVYCSQNLLIKDRVSWQKHDLSKPCWLKSQIVASKNASAR